jgi:hypothetical protein
MQQYEGSRTKRDSDFKITRSSRLAAKSTKSASTSETPVSTSISIDATATHTTTIKKYRPREARNVSQSTGKGQGEWRMEKGGDILIALEIPHPLIFSSHAFFFLPEPFHL